MKLRAPKRTSVRAILPNAGLKAWYYHELVKALEAAALDATNMLSTAWSEAPPTVGIAMDAPSSTTRLQKALAQWGKRWNGKFDKLSVKVAREFARRSQRDFDTSFKAALRDSGFTIQFKPTRKSLEAYKLVAADNVGLIRNLQASLYNRIEQDVWASVRAGADMAKLSEKLQKSYGISQKRAATISRDQNIKAKAVIESTRRQELGLSQGIWQHPRAGKHPRPVHEAWGREHKVFDLSKGLFDPVEGEYVLPGQLINCHCTSRAIIPGLEDE